MAAQPGQVIPVTFNWWCPAAKGSTGKGPGAAVDTEGTPEA